MMNALNFNLLKEHIYQLRLFPGDVTGDLRPAILGEPMRDLRKFGDPLLPNGEPLRAGDRGLYGEDTGFSSTALTLQSNVIFYI